MNARLVEFFKCRGIDLTVEQTRLLDEYKRLLIESSARTNLLSSGDLEKIEETHFADSIAAESFIPHGARVADWGSGAGLPGIPLAITKPDIHMTLVESRQAKAGFLLKAIKELGLVNTRVFPADGATLKERFDIVTVRAVGTIKKILPILLKKLAEGGGLLLYKGPGLDKEIKEASAIIERSGLRTRIEEVTLPSGRTSRHLLLSPRNTPVTHP